MSLSAAGKRLLEAARDGRLKQGISQQGAFIIDEDPPNIPPVPFSPVLDAWLKAPNISVSTFKAALRNGLIVQTGSLNEHRLAPYGLTEKGTRTLAEQP